MLKLIKLIFWIVVVFILAYFLTDIKIAGKTIKEHVDQSMFKESGTQMKAQVQTWIDKKFGTGAKEAIPTQLKTMSDEEQNKTRDDILKEDEDKLKNILEDKKNQDSK